MLCARALVRSLNDAKNYAQQGCAMQFSGITLIGFRTFVPWSFQNNSSDMLSSENETSLLELTEISTSWSNEEGN